MATAYDQIGRNYNVTRRPDARIAAMITEALGDARSVVNVGAGSGSYEPAQISVVAVDPSIEMIRQRPIGSAPAVLARAESLPFPNRSFDAGLAVLTIHHWTSIAAGLNELRRVASRRVVILTYDPDWDERFWFVSHYFPEIIDLDRAHLPTLRQLEEWLEGIEIREVPIPRDCSDGFLGAFWQKPEAYLDPAVRRGISAFAKLSSDAVERGLTRLSDDLRSGVWEQLFGYLRKQDTVELGYRLVIAKAGQWAGRCCWR
jgi:SAM-dependent methyltransferase